MISCIKRNEARRRWRWCIYLAYKDERKRQQWPCGVQKSDERTTNLCSALARVLDRDLRQIGILPSLSCWYGVWVWPLWVQRAWILHGGEKRRWEDTPASYFAPPDASARTNLTQWEKSLSKTNRLRFNFLFPTFSLSVLSGIFQFANSSYMQGQLHCWIYLRPRHEPVRQQGLGRDAWWSIYRSDEICHRSGVISDFTGNSILSALQGLKICFAIEDSAACIFNGCLY